MEPLQSSVFRNEETKKPSPFGNYLCLIFENGETLERIKSFKCFSYVPWNVEWINFGTSVYQNEYNVKLIKQN